MALAIEPAPEMRPHVCADCGRSFASVHGFIYRDGNAYAVYHALLQTEHPFTVADLALSFGSWDEDAVGADRTRVGVRVWPQEGELNMYINDPEESGWGSSETFGQMAKRDNVLGTRREDVALRTAAFVVDNDDRIRGHLG